MSGDDLIEALCFSQRDKQKKVVRKRGKGTNMRKANWRKYKIKEEVDKGQEECHKSQTGQEERDRDRQADRWNKEGRGGRRSHRGRELYFLWACWKPSLSSCCCFLAWVSTVTEWRPLCASVPLLTCNIHQIKRDETRMQLRWSPTGETWSHVFLSGHSVHLRTRANDCSLHTHTHVHTRTHTHLDDGLCVLLCGWWFDSVMPPVGCPQGTVW